jgi:hypothetical protein
MKHWRPTVLPAFLALALLPSVAQGAQADQREEARRLRREQAAARAQARIEREIRREERALELRSRWAVDRRLLFLLGSNLVVLVDEGGNPLMGLEAAVGLRKQLTGWLFVQGRLSLGGGGLSAASGDGGFDQSMVTAAAEITMRAGFGGRTYLGLGTSARLFHAFAGGSDVVGPGIAIPRPSFTTVLAGGVLELGWLLGGDRDGDIGLRALGGIILDTFGEQCGESCSVAITVEQPAFYAGGSLVFAWGFGPGS